MIKISDVIFFDIETKGTTNKDIIDLLFPVPEKKTAEDAPSNYKKEEAIAEWIEREYIKDLEKREHATEKGALDIDTAVIRSIAWAIGDGEIECVGSDDNEHEVIDAFITAWNSFRAKTYGGKSVGFNSINYDWSVILRRLVMLNMNGKFIFPPNFNRYTGEMDLMNVAWNFGYAAGNIKSMKVLAKILGIKPLVEDVTGADVFNMSIEDLILYNKSDVHVTREIFNKFNGVYF